MSEQADPQVGQWLYASCSAQTYGKILRVGQDANGEAVLDIELQDPDDLGDAPCFECPADATACEHGHILRVEVTRGAVITLRDVRWRRASGSLIECRTPGNGCYRCTKLFSLVAREVNP